MTSSYILAIDQGTTSSRTAVYNESGQCVGSDAREFKQYYPQPGWVEHDADEIWETVRATVPRALAQAGIQAKSIAAIGLTNQRETGVFWEQTSGKPLGRAVVWQDRRTTDFCRQNKKDEPWLTERTGLVLDPYFSGTKIRWRLENDSDLRKRAESGRVAWGTVDSFLISRLTGGKVHATDVSNASRTLLLNLKTATWDDELARYFDVPTAILPEVRPSVADYGATSGLDFLPDGIPIRGVAGDQQAALFGQRAFEPGEAKCTYGTGAFFLAHTGDKPVMSRHRLLTTLAATIDSRPLYALEGSVFIAGAAVQWLRDGLKLIATAPEIEALAQKSDLQQPVLFVPALVGMGAPHWVPEACGVIFGVTRATTPADLGRAALEGVAFQVADLIDAVDKDTGHHLRTLRVDGGMARNAWFLQFQADILGADIVQAAQSESTALGAAFLAGLGVGIWSDLEALRRLPMADFTYSPRMVTADAQRRLDAWRRAVQAVITYYAPANH
jgi:glycerol kinase